MLKRFWGIVQRHPLLIGGAVLFVVVLIWLMTRKGSDGGQVASYGTDPAITQANALTAIEQMKTNAAVSMAGIEADVYKTALTKGAEVELARLATDYNIVSKQTDAAYLIAHDKNLTDYNIARVEGESAYNIARVEGETAYNLAKVEGEIAYNIHAQDVALADKQSERDYARDIYGITKASELTAYEIGTNYALALRDQDIIAKANEYAYASDIYKTTLGFESYKYGEDSQRKRDEYAYASDIYKTTTGLEAYKYGQDTTRQANQLAVQQYEIQTEGIVNLANIQSQKEQALAIINSSTAIKQTELGNALQFGLANFNYNIDSQKIAAGRESSAYANQQALASIEANRDTYERQQKIDWVLNSAGKSWTFDTGYRNLGDFG